MMNPLRLLPVPTPVLRSVVFAAAVVGLFAASGSEGLQTAGVTPSADIDAPASVIPTDSIAQEIAGLPQPSALSVDDLSRTQVQTRLATLGAEVPGAETDIALTEPSRAADAAKIPDQTPTPRPAESATTPAPQAEQPPQTQQASLAEQTSPSEQASPTDQVPPAESAEVQVANANPLDDSFTFKDLAEILRKADQGARAFGFIAHSCTADDSCDVDHYLWSLYQRTPKEDTVRQTELKEITIERKVKGKTRKVTITQASSKAVRQDFGWKDPKAAERAGMPLMEYVIGGMDPSFKLKLYNMLRAAEAAGFSPGITSGFRDDYRQSIASGLKAASNMSYHGGSRHGGYGHGMAADVVNVAGGSRDMRFISSSMFWNWIDANGHAYGVGRPYLGRDPPHVAPTEGAEYAKHRGAVRLASTNTKLSDLPPSLGLKKDDAKKDDAKKEAAKKPDAKKSSTKKSDAKKSDVKKEKRAAVRNISRPAKRSRTADALRPKAS